MKEINPDLPQDTEADLAVAVEVGVKANSVVASGDELDSRWVDGVVWGTAEQEQEETALVWCVKWPCYQGMDLQGEKERKNLLSGQEISSVNRQERKDVEGRKIIRDVYRVEEC